MNEINISATLKKLMSSKKKLERDVQFFIDDALNINFDAEAILINNERIQAALECMTTAAHANIIEGPYDQQHYETIRKHLLYQNTENGDARIFWNYFSIECVNVRAEQKGRTKEYIYLHAIYNMLCNEVHFMSMESEAEDQLQVADLNSGKIVKIKPRGVNTRF